MSGKDLVVLVADVDAENAIKEILRRHQSLNIRRIDYDVRRNTGRDPGTMLRGHELLRPLAKLYGHAVVVFDVHGSGREGKGRATIEGEVEDRLAVSGWQGRSIAVAIDPELEIWAFGGWTHLEEVFDWKDTSPPLRQFLVANGYFPHDGDKPIDPKAAFERSRREAGKPQSPAHFRALASRVSLQRCQDGAFVKLRDTLQKWFPTP